MSQSQQESNAKFRESLILYYPYGSTPCSMDSFVGLTFKDVYKSLCRGNEAIEFVADGCAILMMHYQSCCEKVYIEDICGDLSDLIGVPILHAEVSSNTGRSTEDRPYDDMEWTFYRFRTIKGSVVIRWCANTDSMYSTSVDVTVHDLSDQ